MRGNSEVSDDSSVNGMDGQAEPSPSGCSRRSEVLAAKMSGCASGRELQHHGVA
jgi:hypothetical protein